MIFRNEYYFLSNMFPESMTVNKITYSCLKSAFQSFKLEDKNERKTFEKIDGFTAKKMGRKVQLRQNWDEIKDEVMLRLLRIKFGKKHPTLRKSLKNVQPPIVEENTWGDRYWGVYNGKGKNKLGILLEKVRGEILTEDNQL